MPLIIIPTNDTPSFLDRFNHRLATLLVGEVSLCDSFERAAATTASRENEKDDNDEPVRVYWRTPVVLSPGQRRCVHYRQVAYIDITFDYVAPSSASFIGGPRGKVGGIGRRVEATFGAMTHGATSRTRGVEHEEGAEYIRGDMITMEDIHRISSDHDDSPEDLAAAIAGAFLGPTVTLKESDWLAEKRRRRNDDEDAIQASKHKPDPDTVKLLGARDASLALRITGGDEVTATLRHPEVCGYQKGIGQIQIKQTYLSASYACGDVAVVPVIRGGDNTSTLEGQALEMILSNFEKED
jgi:hypothetical protein